MIDLIDPDDIGPIVDAAIRRAMDDVMQQNILPRARENAPGSMSSAIGRTPVQMVGDMVYEMALKAPLRYRAVEEGSGVYGPGGEVYTVKPKKEGGVLHTEDGRFLAHATITGQVPQSPMQKAIDEFSDELDDAILREIFSGLA